MKQRNHRLPKERKVPERDKLHGQHFLQDRELILEMIGIAGIRTTDTVVDIGAGAGAITLLLAKKAGKVLAVENDPVLAAALRRRIGELRHITVVEKDFAITRLPQEPFCVVANIPFYMTTAILTRLLDSPAEAFQRAVLIVAHGAAKGFTARRIRSARLLAWRMWFDIKLAKVVPRHRFSPPPSVDAALLHIRRKSSPPVPLQHRARFIALAEYGLRYPDLPIHEALKGIFTPPQLKQLLRAVGADRNDPICRLNERQWGIVFHTMLAHVERHRWPARRK